MASFNANSGGFSYAQAARGRATAATSQPPSSKVTSGTATPVSTVQPDPVSGSTWADDADTRIEGMANAATKPESERSEKAALQDISANGATSGAKVQNDVSVPSMAIKPDALSVDTNEEGHLAAPNDAPIETNAESKSHASEPSWITERKERQNGTQINELASEQENQTSETPTPSAVKAPTLQESAPPAINPWTKRAEAAKAKIIPPAKPSSLTEMAASKENQRPGGDGRRKVTTAPAAATQSVAGIGDLPSKTAPLQGKRANYARASGFGKHSNYAADAPRSDVSSPVSRVNASERHSPPKVSSVPPPSVKDAASWPTPNITPDKDRKELVEKESVDEKHDEDATPGTKRKKQEWKVIPVVPNVIWETQSMNENKERRPRGAGIGDRGNRGGNGPRARGGYRGGPNGLNGGDRNQVKTTNGVNPEPDLETTSRGRREGADQDSLPPRPRPARATSANSYSDSKTNNLSERRGQSFSDEKRSTPAPKIDVPTKSFVDMRRTKSPRGITSAVSESKDDDLAPKPIPQRNSITPQSQAGDTDRSTPEIGHVRFDPSDNRKDSRGFESTRESTWSAPRGGKRGGRGRGGNGNGSRPNDHANGHSAGHTHGNSISTDYSSGQYGVPPSPSAYQGQRGSNQNPYAQHSRGGWPRGGHRSQSIPVDNSYGRFAAPFNPPGPLAPVQTYIPGAYDYNGYPMSALPYQPYMDQQYLVQMVSTQLEYYFSLDNLLKDMFLRKNMDSKGFVFLEVIANFNRIKQLTQDEDLIKAVCINSEHIEICVGEDGKERLRRREGWEQFLLPLEQRELSAQTEGPQQLHRPDRPQIHIYGPPPMSYRGPSSAGLPPQYQRGDRNAAFPMVNGFAGSHGVFHPALESAYPEAPNGEEFRGRTAKSPPHEGTVPVSQSISTAATEQGDVELDAFPDDQANVLTVVVKMNDQQRLPYHNATSRTFSNGSIDSRSIIAETERPAQTPLCDDNFPNGGDKNRSLPRHASPNKDGTKEKAHSDSEMQFFWVKDQDGPVDNLPTGLTSEPYVQLRLKALEQRDHAATGNCPYDLDVLYQFWSHFLLRNFNNRMYSEFKYYATEDAKSRHNLTGVQNLVRFYSQALNSHSHIRDRVVRDYVALVKNEPAGLEGLAFKQLRSAWRNGALNLKNRKKLADILDEVLKEQLDRTES